MSAIDNALSGMNAAGTQIAVAANNIANQNSNKSIINGQVVNKPYVPQQVDQVSLSTGGVLASVSNAPNPTQQVPDTTNGGLTTVPNVDQAAQLVQTDIASYNYKANLKVIQVQQNLDKSLLDIKS